MPMEPTCPMNKNPLLFSLLLFTIPLLGRISNAEQVPTVERTQGSAFRIDPRSGAPVPLVEGTALTHMTLIRLEAGSSLIFSCPGRIAGKVTGPAQFVLGPPLANRYELDLRQGTVAILLDPDRPRGSPEFAVRTDDGYALAQGTFYAITEYKGQAYGKVKYGTIKTKPKPPMERNFAAYGRKPKPDLGKVAKSD